MGEIFYATYINEFQPTNQTAYGKAYIIRRLHGLT